jgi:hypothetical protein
MKPRTIARALGLASLGMLGGCQAMGGLVGGLGSLFQIALVLAAIALPILLSYYLYTHKI